MIVVKVLGGHTETVRSFRYFEQFIWGRFNGGGRQPSHSRNSYALKIAEEIHQIIRC